MNNLKSGFVSIVGRSNVGKSTLLNRIIGEKISIISNKPQTTRFNLKLIYNSLDSQIVFVDTPGVQNPKNKLGEFMLKESKNSLKDVDLILYMVDSNLEIGVLDNQIIDILKRINLPKICVINKIDTLNSEDLSKIILKYEDMNLFDEIIPISASEGTNVYNLIDSIKSFLPFGPRYYSDDMITDLTERDIVAEIIREKTLNLLRDEIPHGINILIEKFSLRKDKPIVDIDAVICVEKKSHKGMVIGKNGSMILKIGKSARLDIENFLESKVNLKLFVKIDDDWRSKSFKVKEFGYFRK
ncbi:GTPase Era [uncultured Parvimonas sp.]|uniref:GTPase Era n=1 Tax=Parvimonas sp. G1604 TaxID=3388845 RepID=UPI0028D7AECE|nr:GTPase Era [uncultured Parvimonas sp.]